MRPSFFLSFLVMGFLLAHSVGADQASEFAVSPDGVQPRKSREVATLVDAQSVMSVTISPEAGETLRKAAAEVAAVLGKMSGREISVVESAEPKGIVLGTLGQFPSDEVARALEPFGEVAFVDGIPVARSKDSEGRIRWNAVEAFAIRTNALGVRLQGRTEAGAWWAASRFLELLGARRFSPSPVWEIIPKRAEVRFDADEERAPAFVVRDIWFAFGRNPEPQPEEGHFGNLESWQFYAGVGGAFDLRSNHMYGGVYQSHKEEFDANKDKYYALIKGERNKPGKFCLSQPRAREMIVEGVLKGFEAGRSLRLLVADQSGTRRLMASVEPSDGAGWCECDECAKLGSISDRAFLVANEAAAAAEKKYPGANLVGILAYFQHSIPPSTPIAPNILVQLATRMGQGGLPFEELLERWPKAAKNLGIYDYFSTYVWGQDRLRDPDSYVPAADPEGLADKLRDFYRLGYRVICAESIPNFALYGLGYHVAAKTMWNVDADVKALEEDFYQKSFGPAAGPMRAFYELMNPRSGRRMHGGTYARLAAFLDEATTAAAGDDAVLARIAQLKEYLIGDYLQFRTNNLPAKDEERESWRNRIYAHVYQTRFDWVNHYAAWKYSADTQARKAAAAAGAPKPTEKSLPEWQREEALSPERFDALWKELKEFFQPAQPIEEASFHGALGVMTGASEVSGDIAERKPWSLSPLSDPRRVWLFSPEGAPLRAAFLLTSETKQPGRQAFLRVTDGAGKEIFRKTLEAPENAITLEIPVPGPGEYQARIFGAVAINVKPEEGTALFVRNPADIWSSDYFFFMPPGTKEILGYATQDSGLVSPDGDAIAIEPDEQRLFRVPVPESQTGRIWRVSKRTPMTFLNIPNLFSYDPAAVMVPKGMLSKREVQP